MVSSGRGQYIDCHKKLARNRVIIIPKCQPRNTFADWDSPTVTKTPIEDDYLYKAALSLRTL